MLEVFVLDRQSEEATRISSRDQYSIALDIFLETTTRVFQSDVTELLTENKMTTLSVDVEKDGEQIREKRLLLSIPGRMDDGGILVLDTQGLLFSAQRSSRPDALSGNLLRGLRSHEVIFHAGSVLQQLELQKQRSPLK